MMRSAAMGALAVAGGLLAMGGALAQDLSIPLGKDQIRRRLLDECVYAEYSRKDVVPDSVVKRCQCAATRAVRPMTPADVAAYNQDAAAVSARSAALRDAMAGC